VLFKEKKMQTAKKKKKKKKKKPKQWSAIYYTKIKIETKN
jgi:hypothetical protein